MAAGASPAVAMVTAAAPPHLLRRARQLALLAAWVTAAAGLVGLLGCWLDLPLLRSGAKAWTTMKANTGLVLLLGGMAHWHLIWCGAPASLARQRVTQGVGLLVVAIGLVTLLEYVFGLAGGIDEWLLVEHTEAALTIYPNRMGADTALAVVLLGSALVLAAAPAQQRAAQWVTLIALLPILPPLFSYLLAATPMPWNTTYTAMAAPTALALFAWCVALGAHTVTSGPLALLVEGSHGGTLLRALLPAVVAVPLVVNGLRQLVERQGWVSAPLAAAGATTVVLLLLATTVWYLCLRVSHSARAHQQAMARLRESEDLLRLTIDALPGVVCYVDREQCYRVVNQQCAASKGMTREQLVGRRLEDLMPATDYAVVRPHREKVLTGVATSFDYQQWQPDGTSRSFTVTYTPRRDASGTVVGFVGLSLETTEQRQAELVLREREAVLRRFVDDAPLAVAMFDTEMRYLVCSQRWRQDYGLGEQAIIGRSHYDVFPEIGPAWKAIHQRCLRGEPANSDEDRFVRGDGRVQWLRWAIHPWRTGNGAVGGIIIFTEDITEHKQAMLALQRSEARYHSLFSHLPDGFAYCRMEYADGEPVDFIYLEVNDAFGTLTGLQQVVGKRVTEVIPGIRAAHPEILAIYGRVARGGAPERFESYIVPLRCWLAVVVYSPQPEHFVALFYNTNERHQAENALRQSEERYRSLFTHLPDAFATCCMLYDAAGQPDDFITLEVNDAYVPLVGLADSVGRRITEVVPDIKTANPELLEVYGRVARTGVPERLETYIAPLQKWLAISVYSTAPEHFVALISNTTERHLAEAALRQSEERFRLITETITEVFWMVAYPTQALIYVSPAYARVWGQPVASLHADPQPFLAAVAPATEPAWLAAQPYEHEYRIVRPDGAQRWIWDRGYPVRDAAGRVTAYIGVAQDITERKEAADAVRATNEQLATALATLQRSQEQAIAQERLRALGQMASGIAHDFNNSLMVIQGFAELCLLDDALRGDPARLRTHLELIHTSAQDAASVVRRLREFSRPRQADDAVELVQLATLVPQVIAMTEPRWKGQAQAAGLTIEVRAQLAPVPPIPGEAAQLREALANLIINAVDAMTASGSITLSTRATATAAQVSVADTGMGMTPEVRQRCLEPFYSTKGAQGTGLGLAMVYGIVQRHGGHIDIVSEVGQGTTITLTLPLAPAAITPTTAPAAQPAAAVADTPARALRVLLVDDDDAVRSIAQALLARLGHAVHAVSSARQAEEVFRADAFDLVVTDQAMPGMNGTQLALALRQISPRVPIILATGFGDLMVAANEQPPGVDVILGKPFNLPRLRAAISEASALHGEAG